MCYCRVDSAICHALCQSDGPWHYIPNLNIPIILYASPKELPLLPSPLKIVFVLLNNSSCHNKDCSKLHWISGRILEVGRTENTYNPWWIWDLLYWGDLDKNCLHHSTTWRTWSRNWVPGKKVDCWQYIITWQEDRKEPETTKGVTTINHPTSLPKMKRFWYWPEVKTGEVNVRGKNHCTRVKISWQSQELTISGRKQHKKKGTKPKQLALTMRKRITREIYEKAFIVAVNWVVDNEMLLSAMSAPALLPLRDEHCGSATWKLVVKVPTISRKLNHRCLSFWRYRLGHSSAGDDWGNLSHAVL